MSKKRRLWLIGGISFVVGLAAAYFTGPSAKLSDYSDCYIDDDREMGNGEVKVTYLGTSSLLIEDGSTKLMVDGFLSRPGVPSLLVLGVETDTGRVIRALKWASVDSVSAVFVAHSHYDHALDAAYVARYTKARLYGSPSTLNTGRWAGLDTSSAKRFEPGKLMEFGDFHVTVLHASHSPQKKLIADAGQHILKQIPELTKDSTPARVKQSRYREGGSYDLLIRHGALTILVKPSANWVPGVLDGVQADVVFLGVGTLGAQDTSFQRAYYEQTVGKVRPRLVIPIHWDDPTAELSEQLEANPRILDDVETTFDSLIARTRRGNIGFGILQGYASVVLPRELTRTRTCQKAAD